jgi:hypothetical protein
MKRTFIFSTVGLLAATLIFTSCGPSRVYATKERTPRQQPPPPPSRAPYYSSGQLIIHPSPGFIMSRHSSGRYFHRSPMGLLYWKGYDNRFYLDRNYLGRVSYSDWEYREWKRFSKGRV